MTVSVWFLLLIVSLAGGFGGLLNAVLTDGGFSVPKMDTVGNVRIFRPGFPVNMLVGAVAAAISWGVYGPLSMYPLFTAPPVGSPSPANAFGLASLMGAVLVGVGGAKWLTNEVAKQTSEGEKKQLQAAASAAAGATGNKQAAEQILFASPADALKIAKGL